MGNNFIVIVIVFAWLHWFIFYFALSQTNGVGSGMSSVLWCFTGVATDLDGGWTQGLYVWFIISFRLIYAFILKCVLTGYGEFETN